MKTIPALLVAVLAAGCMHTPADLRSRSPDVQASLAGTPEVAAKCVGTKLPDFKRFGEVSYNVTVDLIGVRAHCANSLCALIDLKPAGDRTEAVAYTTVWPAPGITGAVSDAFAACGAAKP